MLSCREDIRKDPAFRAQFHAMCANIGVDPLASNKGVWAQVRMSSRTSANSCRHPVAYSTWCSVYQSMKRRPQPAQEAASTVEPGHASEAALSSGSGKPGDAAFLQTL